MTPQEKFIRATAPVIIRGTRGSGIFPSVKMAQMILESGWGKKIVGNNLFGIKAAGKTGPYWNGDSVSSGTKEYFGNWQTITSNFRAYKSPVQSVKDHTHFLQVNPTYQRNGVFDARTPEDQARALKAAGYATAPGYANTLINLIETYDLKRLDRRAKMQEAAKVVAVIVLVLVVVAAIKYRKELFKALK